jgi:hypothetical protein
MERKPLIPPLKSALLVLGAGFLFSLPMGASTPEPFNEIHFGVNPGTRVLAVTLTTTEIPVKYLWPEEIKVEHEDDSIEYTVTHKPSTSPYRLLKTASQDKSLSESCRGEVKKFLEEPSLPLEPGSVSTTVYVPIEEDGLTRLTVRASDGLKIIDVRGMSKDGDFPGELSSVAVTPWTRGVYLQVSYRAAFHEQMGPSDFTLTSDPKSNRLHLSGQKPGHAAMKRLFEDGSFTEACYKELTSASWAVRKSLRDFLRSKRKSDLFFPVPKGPARTLSLEASDGLTILVAEPVE